MRYLKVKIKKGDKVKMLSGKDNGKVGKVLMVNKVKGRLTVEGLNLLVKHMKPRRQGESGQRIQFPAAVNISNVALVCPKCQQATRVGWQKLADNKKVRKCVKCGETID